MTAWTLAADEPPPVRTLAATRPAAGAGARPWLLTCDHASNRIPRALGDLGVSAAERARHIAWDPGAELLTRRLAQDLGVAAVLSSYSRLVIDVNRSPDDPSAFPTVSDGTTIAGNLRLDDAARADRVALLARALVGCWPS